MARSVAGVDRGRGNRPAPPARPSCVEWAAAPRPRRAVPESRGPPTPPVTRFQKLALATVVATILLVTIGVIVRVTDSGMGCPDWPLCHGQLIPPLDDANAWIEWIHRTVAAVIGFLILGVASSRGRTTATSRSILWPRIAAVLLVVFQAWLGRETVRLNNSGESVTAHLAAAMSLLGLLVFVTVRAFYPARLPGRGAVQRFTLLAVLAAVSTFALLLFGSHVTALDAGLVFPDWPLMNGALFPLGGDATRSAAVRGPRAPPLRGGGRAACSCWSPPSRPGGRSATGRASLRLALTLAVLYPIQAVIGGLQVLTQLADWTQTLHVALGAIIWATPRRSRSSAYYEARVAVAGRCRHPAADRRPATTATTAPTGPRHPPRATRCGPTSP